jgi:hypothetical protein
MTNRQTAIENLEKLREAGLTDERIADYLINNWMTGDDAKKATEDLLIDEDLEDEDEGEADDFTGINFSGGLSTIVGGTVIG